jgi:hypothetical protein
MRRHRNPRRRKGGILRTFGKVALWYGGFCVVNMGLDSYLGAQGGGEAGGLTGAIADMNASLLPLNILNILGGSQTTASLPYEARIMGYHPDGTPIYG